MPITRHPKRAPTKQKRKQKRWYIDASIPKGVPFIGGSSFKAGSGTLQKRSVQAIARQVVNSQKETKQFVVTVGDNLAHNKILTYSPIQCITQGVTATQREGDAIFLRKILCRVRFGAYSNMSRSLYRIFLVWSPQRLLTNSVTDPRVVNQPYGLGASDLFLNSAHLTTQALLNNKTSTQIICEKQIEINQPVGATVEKHVTFDLHCNVFKKTSVHSWKSSS